MRVWAAHEHRVSLAGLGEVFGVVALARDEAEIFLALDGAADQWRGHGGAPGCRRNLTLKRWLWGNWCGGGTRYELCQIARTPRIFVGTFGQLAIADHFPLARCRR